MREWPFGSFKQVAWFAVAMSALVFVGYAAGRYNVVRKINRVLTRPSAPIEPSVDHIPPGPPQEVAESDEYAALNRLLDERLLQQQESAASWRALLEAERDSEHEDVLRQIQEEYLTLLNPWPGPEIDPDARRELWFSKDGVDVSTVDITTHPGIRMTMALLEPQLASPTAPALLLLHGYQGNLQAIVSDRDYHRGFGFELAQQGFIVLAPLRVASTIDTRSTLYTKALAGGWTLEAINLHQLIRATDFLFTLDNVDRDHVGVYGISLGGQHALRLGALDDRLSLVLCSAYFANRFDWLFKRAIPTATVPPGDEMATSIHPVDNVLFEPDMGVLMDDLNLVALIQPRFLGIESGIDDPRHESAEAEFKNVAQLYRHVGHVDRAAFLPFEGGHEVSTETTLPFLKRWASTQMPESR